MTKSLLLTTALLAAASASAMAATDGQTYESVDGLTCRNVWVIDKMHTPDAYAALPFSQGAKARMATVYGDKVVVGFSQTMVVGESSNDYAHIVIFDLATGKYEKMVQLTCGGKAIEGLLCANSIGTDSYGHLWMIGIGFDINAKPLTVYHITDINSGVCDAVGEIKLPEDESAYATRFDYFDLAGDVTGKESATVVMAAQATPTDPAEGKMADKAVAGWLREQSSDEWGPRMDDNGYFVGIMEQTYPADQLNWNGAPVVKIAPTEGELGEQFYVDPFVGYPTLYNQAGAMIESFESCPDALPDQAGANGVVEFTMGDNRYLAYANADYTGNPPCSFKLAKMGEGGAFEGMTALWTMPADGFGTTGDGGSRIISITPVVKADANGKYGCYLFGLKSQNGLGVWCVAEPGWQDSIGGVSDIVADDNSNAPVEYFNLQGMKVNADNLAAGVYVTRQGSKTSKVLVK